MKPVKLVSIIALLVAATAALSRDPANPFDVQLQTGRQSFHVLNRLAYGPRPGDVEAVRRMGVKKWIRQQLNPASVPENPKLEAVLEPMATQRLPTWQLVELTQQPPIRFSIAAPAIIQLVPGDKGLKLMSTSTPTDERRDILKSLTPEIRGQVLAQLPQPLVDGLTEYRMEADRARQMRQEMMTRQVQQQQQRNNPPLSELFTPEQLNVLKHGTDDEKAALLGALDADKRTKVYRAMGPQGVTLLPPAYRRQAALASGGPQGVGVVNEVIEAKLQRAVLSNRQLQEVLVDFWFNHFNVSTGKSQVRNLLASYERDAIRPHVLGRFSDMLLATARHPAMLFYLDNFQSQAPSPSMLMAAAQGLQIRVPGINENYGRELLELHTLGVDGGYTQEDVVNVARVFTGWTIFEVQQIGEFQFNPSFHDREAKKVLGRAFPRGGGENEGMEVIGMLASHPSTARNISRKLAQRFVADAPPPALLDRMAETFMKTDGDLRAVMETMLLSREFLSEGAWRAKVKSPLEFVASSLRALDAEVTDTTALAQRLLDMGQPLYAKAEPTGYPNTSDSWANSVGLLGRMNFASALIGGQISGITVDAEKVAVPGIRGAMLALTGVEAADEAAAALEKAAAGTTSSAPALIATAIIGSPDFQKR